MSLVNQNPGDFFNGGSLYAYTNKTFYPHGTIYGTWQDLNALSTYTAFAEHVGLQAGKTIHPTDLVLFPENYLLIEGKKYFDVVIYTPDKILSPLGNPIHAYIVDPLEEEFSELDPHRPFDVFYQDIVKLLNSYYQVYMNLQVAAKHVEDTINLITPIKNTNLTVFEIQTNIINNKGIIATKLNSNTLTKFYSLVDGFFWGYDELTRKSGVGNILREVPPGTDPLPLINYYRYIDTALGSYRGDRLVNFSGVIKSFYYQNPGEAFTTGWNGGVTLPTGAMTRSLEILQEFGLAAPQQKTSWITSIEGTGGKYNIYGVHNNWDNPLSREEMTDGFGQTILSHTTVAERTTTSATLKVTIEEKGFSEIIHETGLLYSNTGDNPEFSEVNQYQTLAMYNNFTPLNCERISRLIDRASLPESVSYEYILSNLAVNTLYKVRPYMIFAQYSNEVLTGYRYLLLEEKSFSTDLSLPVEPYIPPGLTATISQRTQQAAVVAVNVGSTYSGAITERGVLISTVNEIPEFANNNLLNPGDNNKKFTTDSLTNDYTVNVSSLTWKTKYYVRPYIINYPTYNSTPLIIYGDAVSFRTLPDADIPFITASGKLSADGESIELKATCSMTWDAGEDTELFYYIQPAAEIIPEKVPASAVYMGKKDHTVSSYFVTLQKQISIAGFAKDIYRIVVYGKNTSGTVYQSVKFSVGINIDNVPQYTITAGESSYSSPEASVSARIKDNAYVEIYANIFKLGSTFEWAKLTISSQDGIKYYEENLVPYIDSLGITRYEIFKRISGNIPANSTINIVFTVKTSFEEKEFSVMSLSTPVTWDLTNLYKPLNPTLSKTVKSDTSNITIKVNELYNDNIEEGGKMTLCIYKAGATNGQAYSLTNYTEKKEITTTKGQKEFIFDLKFTEASLYTFVAFYTDTDTRVYRSSYIQHTVETDDVIAYLKNYIFYDLNGASGTIAPTQDTAGATAFVTTQIPVREGYVFSGWNTQPYGGGTSYAPGVVYILNNTVTLYAQWISYKVTVSFDSLGGTAVASQQIGRGDKCTQPENPTRAGYIFSHWFEYFGNMSNKFDFSSPINSNKELNAFWISEITTNGINFDSKGGTLIPIQSVIYNKKAVKPSTPTKAGYYFVDWYTDESYQHAYDFNTPVTSSFTLYAKWSQTRFTVTFNSNGGTSIASQQVASGGLVQRPSAPPVKEGKIFVDWAITESENYNVDSVLYDFNTPVTGNITLYACYSIIYVNIGYNILKYTDANEKISQQPYIAAGLTDGIRTIAKDSYEFPPINPLLEGYVFDGWYYYAGNMEAGATAPQTLNWGVNMLPFDFSQRISSDWITLFSKWRKGAIYHNITFNTGAGATVIPSQKVIAGGLIAKPQVPSKSGYSFSYWYSVNSQTAFDFSTPVAADMVLTAMWLPNLPGTVKNVIFNSTGGTEIATQEVATGAVCLRPSDPTRQNYQFAGWYTDESYTQPFDFTSQITEDITLWAKWEITVLEKDTFNPPSNALPGQRYYFYDRVWIFDATDKRWRLDYKTMMSKQESTKETSRMRVINQGTEVTQKEIEELNKSIQDTYERNEENIQAILTLLKHNQTTVDSLSTLVDPHIIHIKKGEYLSDVINEINAKGDATEEYPYNIYFYNHSRTINWEKFTEKIFWPRYVFLNLVGDIRWWGDECALGDPSEEFESGFMVSKLFSGFSFYRKPPTGKSYRSKSGLPSNLSRLFFGGLDITSSVATGYDDYLTNQATLGLGPTGLIYIDGDAPQDEREQKLYKKINGTLIDVTPNFDWCNLSGYNLMGVYFFAASMQKVFLTACEISFSDFRHANLDYAGLERVRAYKTNFNSSNLGYANFSGADIEYSSFTYSIMNNANFRGSKAENCMFITVNLLGADFRNSKLRGSDFTGSNLQGILVNTNSDFRAVNLTGASLSAALDTKAEFIAAVGAGNVDASTIWIDGTSILS